jgi:hypothetical protein
MEYSRCSMFVNFEIRDFDVPPVRLCVEYWMSPIDDLVVVVKK